MDRILLSHGSGGRETHDLVSGFAGIFDNALLSDLDDAALFNCPSRGMAFTTDSFVVHPLFFPGGDIGRLAVAGTVNDLAVCGAQPLYLSLALIIEEGFSKALLTRVLGSVKKTADEAGVRIVTGDTKVVEKGAADGMFITTAGIGVRATEQKLHRGSIRPGDKVLINGYLGDHGFAIMNARESFNFSTHIKSDAAPLSGLIKEALKVPGGISFMRDPTRGGLATTLNEIVLGMKFGIEIEGDALPVRKDVRAMGEILGIDPLVMGNEGKVVCIVPRGKDKAVLRRLRQHPYGKKSAVIGTVTGHDTGKVLIRTRAGTKRPLEMLSGEPLPRIC